MTGVSCRRHACVQDDGDSLIETLGIRGNVSVTCVKGVGLGDICVGIVHIAVVVERHSCIVKRHRNTGVEGYGKHGSALMFPGRSCTPSHLLSYTAWSCNDDPRHYRPTAICFMSGLKAHH